VSPLRKLFALVAALAGWLVLSALLVPLAYGLWVSFSPDELLRPPTSAWSLRWYELFFRSPRWLDALWNSLIVAALSVMGSLLTGVPLALAVVRCRFRGRRLLSAAVLLPLCVPPVALGMGLLPVMYLLGLWGSLLGLALAHCLVTMPVVYLVTRATLEEISPDLEDAARGLGAGPLQTLWRVTLPLLRPALLAGTAMSLVLSLNEFLLSLFLATPETETLPRVIWPELRYALSPLVAVASSVTILVTLAALALVNGVRRLDRWIKGDS
jgi:ABC-type spermidine/putrescine transport system permease subunit II